MMKKIIMMIFLGAFLLSGCAFKDSTREYRSEKIRLQHPQWDEAAVRKIASRQVEVGMTTDMVLAALGKPDAISPMGDEERWGYAVFETTGRGFVDVTKKFVFSVSFKNGVVVRTEGDRSQLGHISWYQ
ncbi:MAG: outer membrane protein assembly factor BamE [Pseudomonadota bacterium]